jgi:hypothetical protein
LLAITTLVALTAVPGYTAPQKIYTLTVTPSQALAGESTDFFVTMTNKTPGNSNPNSFSVTAPSGFSVTAASISSASNANAGASVTVVGSSRVDVRTLDPVKTNQYVTLKITATTSDITTCSPQGGFTWTATVWTGSNLSGDTFSLSGPAPTTTLTRTCELKWDTQPSNTTIDTNQTVVVGAYAGGSRDTGFAGPLTVNVVSKPDGATLTVGSIAYADGQATFTLNGDVAGVYEVNASSQGLSTPDVEFTLFEATIACGQVVTDETETVTVEWLDTGDDCTGDAKLYTLTRDGNEVEFLADGASDATFKVDVTAWDPEPAQNPVPATYVEPPTPAEPVQWCDGTADPFAPVMPDGASWCLVRQSTEIVGEGMMQVTETFYLKGDAKAFR